MCYVLRQKFIVNATKVFDWAADEALKGEKDTQLDDANIPLSLMVQMLRIMSSLSLRNPTYNKNCRSIKIVRNPTYKCRKKLKAVQLYKSRQNYKGISTKSINLKTTVPQLTKSNTRLTVYCFPNICGLRVSHGRHFNDGEFFA